MMENLLLFKLIRRDCRRISSRRSAGDFAVIDHWSDGMGSVNRKCSRISMASHHGVDFFESVVGDFLHRSIDLDSNTDRYRNDPDGCNVRSDSFPRNSIGHCNNKRLRRSYPARYYTPRILPLGKSGNFRPHNWVRHRNSAKRSRILSETTKQFDNSFSSSGYARPQRPSIQ